MRCAACSHENRDAAKFCEECAAPLKRVCSGCGSELRPNAKFCDECGAATAARPVEAAGARKIVTIVFADLVGSTALHERLDPESAGVFMESYYRAMRAAVEAYGGTVTQLLGDGVKAVFGAPRVSEDDAIRAVRAAVEMQRAFHELAELKSGAVGKTGLRVAVNTGEVVASDTTEIIGDPVNVAARLQEQGRDGDVVIGESTHRLVAALITLELLGSFTLKGRAEPVKAYRVVSLERPAGALSVAFVGRDDELARITAVYEAATAAPAARLAVLLGSPGLGKSRLIDEFAHRLGEAATVLAAQCDAAGGATFAPLAEALRELLHLDAGADGNALRTAIEAVLTGDEVERARITVGITALLAGFPAPPEETFFVVRRLLAALAGTKPVVLVIDDLHWAEPLLLDLVEHLVQWGSGVPLLVLVGARPELRDTRSSLATPGGLVAEVVTLAGLDAGAATRLAANVIGASDLPAAVAAKVLATSEGNPLFVGELVRMLVHEGALKREGDRWGVGAGLADIEMPPTIHALLGARIERLRPEERSVLERAAVVGRHFSRNAVAALLRRDAADLDARLESLRRSELIERDTGWFLGEPVLRFHHVLIRDAAYRRLLKGTRAELHGHLADWIEAQVGDAPEHDEMIGWHLEQAHQHLRELGPIDAAGAALGERAARRLAAAGRRALARDDVSLAAGLCGRALDRLTPDAPERADLVLDWCEALLSAGDVGPAAAAIAELERVAADSPRLHAWHTCFAGQLTVLTAPEALHATSERVGAAARDLAALDDAAGEAKAHFVHAQALARLGKVGACEAALDQALAAARRAGDRRRANAVLAGAPLAALWGPSPVTRASGRCLDVVRVLRITQGAPAVEAVALSCQGVLEALRGRTEAARRMLASSRTMVEELGISHRLYETDVFAGRIDLLEGDAVAAEHALRAGYEGLRDLGLGIDAARAAALLGRALLAQDRAAEAETLSHESEMLAGDDLQAAIAWRGVRAEALARRGDHAAAISFAEAAVAIAAATDALLDHADARLALAAALRAGGRRAEADAEERRAFELWEAKGATLLAERARRSAADSVAAVQAPDTRPEAAPRVQRRVRANTATALAARFEAVFAAGEADAIAALWADSLEVVDHANGATYGRDGHLASIRRLRRARDPILQFEPLAGLGASLCITRRRIASQGTAGGHFDVGASEYDALVLFEIDESGSCHRLEIFASDHLGAAIAHLYERYAEGLPEGHERERAAVAARAVAFMLTPGDAPDLMELYAPTYEDVDHRSVGYGTLALEDSDKLLGAFREVADSIRFQVDAVLALEPHGLVRKTTTSGVWREGGGSFERTVCTLSVFGPDGRVTSHETFDPEREAEALARFDALTGASVPLRAPEAVSRVRARVRPNAVTRDCAKFEAICAARDFAALATFFAEDAECIDHPVGATYGADGMRKGNERLLQSPDARLRFIPLATLGESWGLVRREMSASSSVGGRFDVGAYEIVDVAILGTDERGRLRHFEIFATDRLRAAIVRLYERYAESVPNSPARTRASAIGRSLAAFDGSLDADRIANAHASSFECVDHRTLGTWSVHGREEWRKHWRGQTDLSAGLTVRDDDVLALESAAIVLRHTFFGTSHTSGGAFENAAITVVFFGADGLIARTEIFEPDQEAEALARFDALTAGVAPKQSVHRRVRPNAATATNAAIEAAFARRDLATIDALLADPMETIEHPTGTTYGRKGQLESSKRMMRHPDLEFRIEPLATLGEALCLFRRIVTASGTAGGRFDVGEYELESIILSEVDGAGRMKFGEVFASDHLCQATARLYARYAEFLPEGPEQTRAAGIARSFAVWDGPLDPDRIVIAYASSYVCVDHRSLGTWSAQGLEEWRQHWRGQAELAAGFTRRDDDILAFAPHVHLTRGTFYGTNRASGGPFENVILALSVFGADGLYERDELFESDREAEALARFDALTADAAQQHMRRRVRANAATRSLERFEAVLAARDRDGLGQVFDESLDVVHHPTGTTYGRREMLKTWRSIMKADRMSFRSEILASLGEALALERHFLSIEGLREDHVAGFGLVEFDEIVLIEVEDRGRWRHVDLFTPDHLGDAILSLYERHAELLEGPARARAAATARSVATHYQSATDPDRFAVALAREIVAVDHRTVGFGTLHGRDAVVAAVRALVELSEDVTWRFDDVLALSEHANLCRGTQRGRARATGGEWERLLCSLRVHDADGLISRWEIFEAEQEAAALARYDELALRSAEAPATASLESVWANAVTRFNERFVNAWVARDWGTVAALHSTTGHCDDRRRLMQLKMSAEDNLAQLRVFFEVPQSRWVITPLATRGERLALSRMLYEGSVAAGGGALAIDYLCVDEVDAEGLSIAVVLFDVGDLDAAYAELDARYEAGEGAVRAPLVSVYTRAIATRDWDAAAAMCAPAFAEYDHRPFALFAPTQGGEAWARSDRTLVELAPDTAVRIQHARYNRRGALCQLTWSGSRDGSHYEIPLALVIELDEQSKFLRSDMYDREQIDQARARFAELAGPTKTDERFSNAATRALDRGTAALGARDWEGFAALFAAEFRFYDRTSFGQFESDAAQFLAGFRQMVEITSGPPTLQVLATRGERLALGRFLWRGAAGDVGPSEVEWLLIVEVDDRGDHLAVIWFNPNDVEPAYAELDARWRAGEGTAHGVAATVHEDASAIAARREWDAAAALFTPTLVVHDHRLVSFATLHGPAEFLKALGTMYKLAPDACYRRDHLRATKRGFIADCVWLGTRDGGAFESPFVIVAELDASGRIERMDFYEPEHLEAALTRFEEIKAIAPLPRCEMLRDALPAV